MQQPSPESSILSIHSAALSEKVLARRTGGKALGDHLGFYADDAFIHYRPGEVVSFWTENAWQEGYKPSFERGDQFVNLINSRVILEANRARIVRATRTEEGLVRQTVLTLADGRANYRRRTFPEDGIQRIRDQQLRKATILSLQDAGGISTILLELILSKTAREGRLT